MTEPTRDQLVKALRAQGLFARWAADMLEADSKRIAGLEAEQSAIVHQHQQVHAQFADEIARGNSAERALAKHQWQPVETYQNDNSVVLVSRRRLWPGDIRL